MKYVLYIDYTADYTAKTNKYIEYRGMEAKDLLEAIEEADRIHDSETMYLIRIMEKTGKVEKDEDGWKKQDYKAIMCHRICGWHRNTEENGEGSHEHVVTRYYKKDYDFYSLKEC